jgi:hypothetical protein
VIKYNKKSREGIIMKKMLLIFICLLFWSFPAFAAEVSQAEDSQIVSSFNQYLNDKMAQILATYDGQHYIHMLPSEKNPEGYWRKVDAAVNPNYKIDVQKTDSLDTPYIATLEVTTKYRYFASRPTREAAEAATDGGYTVTNIYRFSIAYQNNTWVVTEAQQYDTFFKKWKTCTRDLYLNLSCLYRRMD